MPQIVGMTVGVTHTHTHSQRGRERLRSGVCWVEIDIVKRMLLLRLFVLLTSRGAGLTLLVGFTSRLSGIPHCRSTPILASFQLRFCVALGPCIRENVKGPCYFVIKVLRQRTYSFFFFF